MAATPPATLIDVVVLVFARSELKHLVGTDALRTVLSGSQRALFPEPGTMSLEPVWELIESQPGFDPEKAVPPMCRIKTWENQLKVKVTMPTALADLDLAERDKNAMQCNVGDDELNKILKPAAAPTPKAEVTRAIESSSGPSQQSARSIAPKIALGAACVGLIAAGVSIYFTMKGGDTNTVKVSVSDITAEIPLTDVRRNGNLMVATVTDKAWLAKPEFERRKQLEAMGPKVRMQQARGLMLLDDKGSIIATFRLDRTPQVTFTKR